MRWGEQNHEREKTNSVSRDKLCLFFSFLVSHVRDVTAQGGETDIRVCTFAVDGSYFFNLACPNEWGKWTFHPTCCSIHFKGVINIALCPEQEDKIKICVTVGKTCLLTQSADADTFWRRFSTFIYPVSLSKKVTSELDDLIFNKASACIENIDSKY